MDPKPIGSRPANGTRESELLRVPRKHGTDDELSAEGKRLGRYRGFEKHAAEADVPCQRLEGDVVGSNAGHFDVEGDSAMLSLLLHGEPRLAGDGGARATHWSTWHRERILSNLNRDELEAS